MQCFSTICLKLVFYLLQCSWRIKWSWLLKNFHKVSQTHLAHFHNSSAIAQCNGWLSGRLGAFEEVEANSIRSIWIANIDSFPHWRLNQIPQPDLDFSFSNLLKNSHTPNLQPGRSWNWVQIVWFITTLVPVSPLGHVWSRSLTNLERFAMVPTESKLPLMHLSKITVDLFWFLHLG